MSLQTKYIAVFRLGLWVSALRLLSLSRNGSRRDYTRGFEAGLVGGLADWFAVTALFRHPMGIPIPHTALLPKTVNG